MKTLTNTNYVEPQRINFDDHKQWFKDNGLYDDLELFQVSPDGKELVKISFKRDLTAAEITAIKQRFSQLN